MVGTSVPRNCGYSPRPSSRVRLGWPREEMEMTQSSLYCEMDLLRRARGGDREAFDVLVRRHSGRILATSRRILRNAADAEDNAQNALVKAFVNFRQFRQTSLLSTWLTKITINEALMKLRASAAERQRVTSACDTNTGKSIDRPSKRISPEA